MTYTTFTFALFTGFVFLAFGVTEARAQTSSASVNFPIYSGNSMSGGSTTGASAPIGGEGSRPDFNADAYARKEATRIHEFERVENATRFMPRERRATYFKSDQPMPDYLPLK